MAIYHLSMSTVQRSAGQSATARAAYRSGQKIHDERTAATFDYSRKERIQETYLYNCGGLSREDFWNQVESHHKRGDAVTAREVEVALPHDIPPHRRVLLAKAFAECIAGEYTVGVDCAIHTSDSKTENWHAHIMLSSCWCEHGQLGRKVDQLDPIWCKRNDTPLPADYLRPIWEDLVNSELERAGISQKVSHESHKKRGLEELPTRHEGPSRFDDTVTENAWIRERNASKKQAKETIKVDDKTLLQLIKMHDAMGLQARPTEPFELALDIAKAQDRYLDDASYKIVAMSIIGSAKKLAEIESQAPAPARQIQKNSGYER